MRMGTSIEEQKVFSGIVLFEVYNKVHTVQPKRNARAI